MTRSRARSIIALLAVLTLCGCAGSMRARYAEHLTTVIKPGQPDPPTQRDTSPTGPTALSAVPDY